jgi:hypothetical protein
MDNLMIEGEVIISGNQDVVHIDEKHAQILVFQQLEETVYCLLEHW